MFDSYEIVAVAQVTKNTQLSKQHQKDFSQRNELPWPPPSPSNPPPLRYNCEEASSDIIKSMYSHLTGLRRACLKHDQETTLKQGPPRNAQAPPGTPQRPRRAPKERPRTSPDTLEMPRKLRRTPGHPPRTPTAPERLPRAPLTDLQAAQPLAGEPRVVTGLCRIREAYATYMYIYIYIYAYLYIYIYMYTSDRPTAQGWPPPWNPNPGRLTATAALEGDGGHHDGSRCP